MTRADERLWHGGWPGLSPGDLLLPPAETGNARQAKGRARLVGDLASVTPDDVSLDWVHFTPHRNVALAFAGTARIDFGAAALYVVEPIGEVEVDPDMPVQGLRAHSAKIVTVYDPHVTIDRDRARRLHAALLAVERGITVRDAKWTLGYAGRRLGSGPP